MVRHGRWFPYQLAHHYHTGFNINLGPVPLIIFAVLGISQVYKARPYLQMQEPSKLMDGVSEHGDSVCSLLWHCFPSLHYLVF